VTGDQWYAIAMGVLVIVAFAVGALVSAHIARKGREL